MWATGDPAKVRLLLAAGANSRATNKGGATAVLAVAVRENAEVIRILQDAGADMSASMTYIPNTPIRVNVRQLAWTTNERMLRELIGGEPPQLSQLIGLPGSTPFSGFFAATGFSMRKRTASGIGDGIKAILALGADPKCGCSTACARSDAHRKCGCFR